ncbi:CGNR zinc finger domain-containing protein [Allokutzneria sp. A3M-2-11 16]|uniref:CGNR zinc finger domain-containing protein n=1 Tax=Allokutzneria sp. A3M-2-11 16 TaxID=2962043 RepID=UPI0020B8D972|nr:CGNR zinc finger domain-containing protein [Allokutzneria sp. A3M-2-11 16]MCP3801206.1 CGNR zinc finger domain-containing protein [Allokutzneria sp. A3M-2-11 16]
MAKRDWIWDGGRPSVDLVNTLRDRKTGHRELLDDADALAEWLRLAELADVGAAQAEPYLDAARDLREVIDRVTRGDLAEADVTALNAWAARQHRPPVQVRLTERREPVAHVPAPDDPVASALGAAAVDAITLLLESSALRICASETCGLRFVDRSPARNRQWCSMARCGNRAKARQHYARHKTT